jgi:hypothetical protein
MSMTKHNAMYFLTFEVEILHLPPAASPGAQVRHRVVVNLEDLLPQVDLGLLHLLVPVKQTHNVK